MIYDISPPITEALPVWPGDLPPERKILLDIRRGASVTLSALAATVHLGAHADGHNHIDAHSPGIEARPLYHFLGLCQVVRVAVERGGLVTPAHLHGAIEAPRVLIRTDTALDPTVFPEDFAAISSELVDHLHEEGVRLIGIDTPGVDPFSSSDLPAHRAFVRNDMSLLEGLVLAEVPDGLYELIALPLRLVGFDASPVRAILRTWPPASDDLSRRSRRSGRAESRRPPQH